MPLLRMRAVIGSKEKKVIQLATPFVWVCMYAQDLHFTPDSFGVVSEGKGASVPPENSDAQDQDIASEHRSCVERIVVARDQAAFTTLFDYFGPRVKSFLMSRRLDPQAADDLAQEVMLTLWRKAHLYRPDKASVSTWVYTIARNRMIDDQRVEAKRARLDTSDPSQEQPAPATPEEEVQRASDISIVTSALQSLPQSQEEIMRLSFMDGQSHHEIAERLGLPLGTVKSRIRLARQRLSDYFGVRS